MGPSPPFSRMLPYGGGCTTTIEVNRKTLYTSLRSDLDLLRQCMDVVLVCKVTPFSATGGVRRSNFTLETSETTGNQ